MKRIKKAADAFKHLSARQIIKALVVLFCILVIAGGGIFTRSKMRFLTDQQAAGRWSPEGGAAQISCFFPENAGVTSEQMREFSYLLEQGLIEASITTGEGTGAEADRVPGQDIQADTCYSTLGTVTISYKGEDFVYNAVGAGGNFFHFHPLKLVAGSYFSGDDLMKDGIVIDEDAAFQLFGSNNVVGMSVVIGGVPHHVTGVVERQSDTFAKAAGLSKSLVYLSFDSMEKYGQIGPMQEEDSDHTDPDIQTPEGNGTGTTVSRLPFTGNLIPPTVYAAEDGESSAPDTAENATDRSGSDSSTSDGVGGADGASTSDPGIGSDDTPSQDSNGVFGGEDLFPGQDKAPDSGSSGGMDSGSGSGTDSGSGGAIGGGTDSGGDVSPGQEQPQDQPDQEVIPGAVYCFEAVLPEPVEGFARSLVKNQLAGLAPGMEVVDNSARFKVPNLVHVMGSFGVRSMRVTQIRYPYWENIARAFEDVFSLVLLIQMICGLIIVLIVIISVVNAYRHKRWTAAGLVRAAGIKVYDLQSDLKYRNEKWKHF